MRMVALLQGIKDWFNAQSELVSIFGGGFWRDRRPEGSVFPYVVTTVISGSLDLVYGGDGFSTPQIQFAVIGIDHDDTGNSAGQLFDALDGATITPHGGQNTAFSLRRIGEPIPMVQPQDGNNQDLWQWTVTYEFSIE